MWNYVKNDTRLGQSRAVNFTRGSHLILIKSISIKMSNFH